MSLQKAPPQINLSPAETEELIELFKACDSAETSCEQANADKAKVIQEQQALLVVTTDENTQLKAKTDSNAKMIVGFIAGILITGAIVHFTH